MRKNNVIARRAKPDEAIQVICRLQGEQISAWIASHSLAMTEILLTFSHRPC
ncbi:MAG: hypothetical protein HYW48_03440 [Deltaproteobacteria bacterium]|nr:hypothetical protein [Deltaproteobacteria bacterium]